MNITSEGMCFRVHVNSAPSVGIFGKSLAIFFPFLRERFDFRYLFLLVRSLALSLQSWVFYAVINLSLSLDKKEKCLCYKCVRMKVVSFLISGIFCRFWEQLAKSK